MAAHKVVCKQGPDIDSVSTWAMLNSSRQPAGWSERMAFQVLAINDSVVAQARETMASPQYGHPAHVEVATGTGPCRSCLHTFEVGQEERILFTYNPFDGLDGYPSPGPVFIHRTVCSTFRGDGFPETLKSLPLTLEAYGDDRWILGRTRVTNGEVDEAIETLFANPGVRYLHVRHTEAGCFIAQVNRVEG
jgi:hypothetical protein